MAITLETAARNAACDAVVDLLDGGTIEYQTAGSVEVATLGLGTPAFGAASGGSATANAITSDTNATGGTVAKAVFKASGGATIFTVSVTGPGGGGEIEATSTESLTFGAGDTAALSSFTHTQPA